MPLHSAFFVWATRYSQTQSLPGTNTVLPVATGSYQTPSGTVCRERSALVFIHPALSTPAVLAATDGAADSLVSVMPAVTPTADRPQPITNHPDIGNPQLKAYRPEQSSCLAIFLSESL